MPWDDEIQIRLGELIEELKARAEDPSKVLPHGLNWPVVYTDGGGYDAGFHVVGPQPAREAVACAERGLGNHQTMSGRAVAGVHSTRVWVGPAIRFGGARPLTRKLMRELFDGEA